MTDNEISEKIIGCAIEVHKSLGPGLLESAYLEFLVINFNVLRFKELKDWLTNFSFAALCGKTQRFSAVKPFFTAEPQRNRKEPQSS
ncbi:MAG: GxxExxY protein [Bacteroidetes bacterium]|nr:GxxExxY protein [Bacteroidota bacterium]